MIAEDERTLLRRVTGALTFALDVAVGSRLPVPPWVRETRDQAVAVLRASDAETALEELRDTRTTTPSGAGARGGGGST